MLHVCAHELSVCLVRYKMDIYTRLVVKSEQRLHDRVSLEHFDWS